MSHNRLRESRSPYLRQHAANPVHWYPWCDEAFAEASRLDRPVFLSIGYATCHWCHVMAHESFEDDQLAGLINQLTIPVKVDREEHPAVDAFYMRVTQAMSGGGGWPMTLLLTPGREAFFAATYLPPQDRDRRMGLRTLLLKANEVWQQRRSEVERVLADLRNSLSPRSSSVSAAIPDQRLPERARRELLERFDAQIPGFGDSPRFPQAQNLSLLLHFGTADADSVEARSARLVLDAMLAGGIHDQLAGGLHRYSTDRQWLVPHFEKMLYDQALLLSSLCDAYCVFHSQQLLKAIESTIDYVTQTLNSGSGGYCCGEDADSEGEEGVFYLWTQQQIEEILRDPLELKLATLHYGVRPEGNHVPEHHHKRDGRNILFKAKSALQLAFELKLSEDEVVEHLVKIRARLQSVREMRPRPLLDDKVLADWNGLLLTALSRAARVCQRGDWLDLALSTADHLLTDLRDTSGRLLHLRYDTGQSIPALLEDHAFVIQGLLECYRSAGRTRDLKAAKDLADFAVMHFTAPDGGFYQASADESLPARLVQDYGGALPAGQEVMAQVLLVLSAMLADTGLKERAGDLLKAMHSRIARNPSAWPTLMRAVELYHTPPRVLLLRGEASDADFQAACRLTQLPSCENLLVLRDTGDLNSLLEWLPPHSSAFSAHLCHEGYCGEPVRSIEELECLLSREGFA